MNIDVPIKYETTYFADVGDTKPQTTTVLLLQALKDKELMPTTFYEVGANIEGGRRPGIQLTSPDEAWRVTVAGDRLSVSKHCLLGQVDEFGTPDRFTDDASELLAKVLSVFPQKGRRLSLISEGLVTTMSASQLAAAYGRFLKASKFYNANVPFEWDARSAASLPKEICGKPELVNAITSAKRQSGQLRHPKGPLEFDGIFITLDVNTSHKDRAERFEQASLTEFYGVAVGIHSELRDSVLEELDEVQKLCE